ncbi:ribonuclease BN (tRNA processing enzyme) [Anaerosolibacter carboniphilus]|uniref:Ribonuclease BN (tRNA processing enzyme) n=1 Tax=Anaerosolibacter carboniphilus TaxID=1417629 RepID=A0A841L193_9FIRM|nr:MBL fold metallo-hydrolase [Anaerosolibacter carboniphilus]MBB6217950.1 ribonuclease BN (tRNA processing enzyme) [Anaerosolibacter carboniphilus]
MRITVLGNSGPYPRAGGACSGYLFENENTKILIDCGNGTLGRLQQIIKSLEDLDMIIISHLHSDHIADAMVLRYAIGINKTKGIITKVIPLYAPAEPKEDFDKLQFQNAFLMNEIYEDLIIPLNGLTIHFKRMEHPVPSYGIAIEKDGKKFVYSADTKYCDQIFQLAQDADLLLCESGVLERDRIIDMVHLSAKEAAEIGKISKVKRLMLTHFWPGYSLDEILQEAKENFDGDLILSEEMKTYEI